MDTDLKRLPVFQPGDKVACEDGSVYTVISFLGQGGQGGVYRVRGAEGDMALKWYHAERYLRRINAEAFWKNLKRNVENGVPTLSGGDSAHQFVWPKKLVRRQQGSFGYIMDLFDPRFESLSNILMGRKRGPGGSWEPIVWPSWFTRITAALNIVRAFEILHAVGLSYQDLNEGGMAIDLRNGAALICDCDNVSPDGTNLGILGVMRYMAPEVVLGQKLPDRDTDRYSLAVILFLLLLGGHPMHGTESIRLHGDENLSQPEADRRIYGFAPHYCLNQQNPVNPPDPRLHKDVRRLCSVYPRMLMEAFDQVFTTGIDNMNARLSCAQWRKVLLQVRDCLVLDDGQEAFFYTPQERPLPALARVLVYPHDRRVLCMPGKILYRYHLEEYGVDYATPVGKVVLAEKQGVLALYNASGADIIVHIKDKTRACPHGSYLPLLPGGELKAGKMTIRIE